MVFPCFVMPTSGLEKDLSRFVKCNETGRSSFETLFKGGIPIQKFYVILRILPMDDIITFSMTRLRHQLFPSIRSIQRQLLTPRLFYRCVVDTKYSFKKRRFINNQKM